MDPDCKKRSCQNTICFKKPLERSQHHTIVQKQKISENGECDSAGKNDKCYTNVVYGNCPEHGAAFRSAVYTHRVAICNTIKGLIHIAVTYNNAQKSGIVFL